MPAAPSSRFPSATRWAIAGWIVVTLACAILAFVKPRSHTVYPIYMHSADEWVAGRDIYVKLPGFDYFRYSPTVAVFFVPWRFLGDGCGGALWRILGVGLLSAGMSAWSRYVWHRRQSNEQVGLLFLLVTPFLLQNVHNGQSNTHLLGLLLLGAAECGQGRRWHAAFWFAPAILFKPYLMAIPALFALVDRRLVWRLFVAILIGAAVPYLFQSPQYVTARYVEWFRHLTGNDRAILELRNAYRDVALLFRVYLLQVPASIYLFGSALIGLGLASLVCRLKRTPVSMSLQFEHAFALGCGWATVFGPATESCTYLILAPALAASVISKPGAAGRWPRLAYSLFVGTIAASLFPNEWQVQVLGPQPIAGLIALSVFVVNTVKAIRQSDELN